MKLRVHGAYAALATPIDTDGQPDIAAFERLIEFLLARGLDGLVMGGATGEYAHLTIEDRARMAELAIRRVNGRAHVFTSVGTSSIFSTLNLAKRMAGQCGALLLPMPYFFRYEQQDLKAFCETVVSSVESDFLLYNLPGFTNPLHAGTAIELIHGAPNLIGMKDSSGDRDNLGTLHAGREGGAYSLMVGDDSLLLSAAKAGWDGVISGIACFAPELIGAVYRSYHAGRKEEAEQYQGMLDAIIEWVVRLPIPWAVRVGLAARGIPNGPMHVPPSPGRAQVIKEFDSWFRAWVDERGWPLQGVWPI